MESKRTWSTYQQAGIRDAQEGSGHTVFVARAGSGKSTLQEELVCHVPQGSKVLVCAFNTEIKEAFKEREERILARRPDLAGRGGLEIKTVCGLGLSVCSYAFRGIKVDKYKAFGQAEVLVPGDEFRAYRSLLVKITGLAKGFLVDKIDDACRLVAHKFDLEIALLRAGFDPEKATEEQEQIAIKTTAKDMLALMTASKADTSRVDFDDMWWFPIVLNLRGWGYDRIFVDEAQDLCYCQVQLIKKMIKQRGRICAVGDPMQVIYEFRGTTADMLDIIIRELHAKVLPLSITYRNARLIVELAKNAVDDFTARPGAPDGILEKIETNEYEAVYELARPGDFIVSRKNAPLLSLCIGFLKRGIPSIVRGRKDVAEVFLSMIDRSKAKTIESLLAWVDKWETREVKRLTKKDPDADTSSATDTAEAIRVLAGDVEEVSEIRSKVELLFTDGDDKRRVVLTSTHKAKGLERERVIMLDDTYRPSCGGEELRLWYVAVTRAKDALYLVRNEKKKTKRAERKALAQSAEQ